MLAAAAAGDYKLQCLCFSYILYFTVGLIKFATARFSFLKAVQKTETHIGFISTTPETAGVA